jgi:glutamate/tyrosine decarboxylase-like PLP-dependent enzyme
VAVWDGAPAATEVELRVIQWLKEMSGFSPHAAGLLTSGGSMANFICLLAARSALDPDVREEGLAGKPPMTLYLTEETHYCVVKAAEMMGLGRKYIRRIALDSALRMDPAALAEAILADRRSDMRPMAVVATLGTVSTGACDDLLALTPIAVLKTGSGGNQT